LLLAIALSVRLRWTSFDIFQLSYRYYGVISECIVHNDFLQNT
jgi:hypothetical protein